MMHVFRLLQRAIEIGREGKIQVRRHDRDFLLKIKSGKYAYEDLVKMAKEKQEEMEAAFAESDLPDRPDVERIEELLVELRERLYL